MPPEGAPAPVPPSSLQASMKTARKATRDGSVELRDQLQMVRDSQYCASRSTAVSVVLQKCSNGGVPVRAGFRCSRCVVGGFS